MSTPIRLQLDSARFAAGDDGETDGTIGLVVYTGTAVGRRGYYQDAKGRETYGDYALRLSLDAAHVRMGRLQSGAAPLLREHRQDVDAVLGRIVSAGNDGVALTARAQLSDAPGDSDLVAKIRAGIVRNVSVGAFLHTIEAEDLESEPPRFVATDWEPFEASAVAVGADPGAQVSLALDLITPAAPAQEPATMSTQTPAAQVDLAAIPARNAELRLAARLCGVSAEAVAPITDDVTLSLDAGRAKILALAAAREDARGIEGGRSAITMGTDEGQRRGEAMQLALSARSQGRTLKDSDHAYAREYRSMTCVEMARDALRRSGQESASYGSASSVVDAAMRMRSSGGSEVWLSGGAHSTSDFPLILADSSRKEMRRGYELKPGIHRLIARQRTLRDYLDHKHVLLGDAPDFAELAEGAAPKFGPMAESGGSVALDDHAAGVAITRRALINDELDAFMGTSFRFGQKAMRKETRLTLAVLTGGTSGDWGDGEPLFASAHANIDGTGAAPSVARLDACRQLMAAQTGTFHASQTGEPLNIEPRFVIVPDSLLLTTEQLFSGAYIPSSAGTVMTRRLGSIEVVSDPLLTGTRWYTSCDPNAFDALEYCYLEGESGVVIDSMPDWDTESLKIKARLAFAAHAKDYRGLTTNAGA